MIWHDNVARLSDDMIIMFCSVTQMPVTAGSSFMNVNYNPKGSSEVPKMGQRLFLLVQSTNSQSRVSLQESIRFVPRAQNDVALRTMKHASTTSDGNIKGISYSII